MKKSRHSDEQVVRILHEVDRDSLAEMAKRNGVSAASIYAWRKRFGGMASDEVKRLALVLAFSIAIAIGRSPWFGHWMANGRGWDAFDPLLNFFGVIGVEGEGNVVVNTLLVVSFVLSFALAWFSFGVATGARKRRAK